MSRETAMKRTGLIFGVAICAAAMSSAQAADLPPYPEPTYYPVSPPWSGLYAGLHLGGGGANAAWTNSFDGIGDRARPFDIVGGGQAGYNYQIYSWVLGAEATVTGAGITGTSIDGAGFGYGVKTDWMATLAARVGYEYNRILVYTKGGAAFADSRETIIDPTGIVTTTATTARVGWTVGVGFELPLSRNWSARVEYDYLDFALHSLNVTLPNFGPVTNGSTLGIQTLTAGINYRF
jgi:outer membrane immunogenic protein